MKLDQQFRENDDYEMNVGATKVYSANFGRTRVDVYQEAEPASIWRGSPPQEVGKFPYQFWRYVVHGEMSGIAMTREVAQAKGEVAAWKSEANAFATNIRYVNQVPYEIMSRDEAMFTEILKYVMERFPVDMNPAKEVVP